MTASLTPSDAGMLPRSPQRVQRQRATEEKRGMDHLAQHEFLPNQLLLVVGRSNGK